MLNKLNGIKVLYIYRKKGWRDHVRHTRIASLRMQDSTDFAGFVIASVGEVLWHVFIIARINKQRRQNEHLDTSLIQ